MYNINDLQQKTWKKLIYHPVQAALWQYNGLFAAVVAGRQSGKSEICQRKLVLQLPIKKLWADPTYYYVWPTRDQAKRNAWERILNLIPKNWIASVNIQDMRIKTIFGSVLYLAGADKPHRLEGNYADGIVVDESSDQKPGLYEKSIFPMLATRNGFCYRIGVPKRSGIGRLEFREFFNKGLEGKDGIASFTWKSSAVWSKEKIEAAKAQMSEQDYAEQCEAMWQDVGGTIYYSFSNDNIRDDRDVCYNPTQEIVVGCDFNVDPMCWTLSHYIDNKLYTFDEIFLRNTNTQATLDFLHNKYYQHESGWTFIGDATSRAKKTSAVTSDYYIIKNDARFGEKKVFFPERNPHVRDRFAAVNAALRTANGNIRLYINVSCKRLINDLNMVSYIEGTTEPEDYTGTDVGHMSDAHGYVIRALMPVRYEIDSAPAIYAA